ncbi:glycosyltransferase [Streptomyces alboniger]|uniref:Glycosyltransferase n=1 Tax=Streptomyces alboniger TaxID=132473 RepID=A0A5J6HL99_STRAD|nr:glycosyltransferase [Streptomyces alboniger]
MDSLDAVVRDVAFLIMAVTLVYNGPLIVSGILFARRGGASLRGQLALSGGVPVALPGHWAVFVLIPCLNEERVIGNTVRCLLDLQPGVRAVVIDDGSDDRTAALAEAAGAGRIEVVRRALPEARRGKGAALNAGLRHVRHRVRDEGLDPARVLVCVLDADGRLTPGATARVAALFEPPEVGGAQLAVRIRDRGHVALRFQDFEFWGLSAISQFGRVATGSVSMGGNGQFTRLSALDSVGEQPWSYSLTEDLDLGVSLAVHGWTVTSTTGAYVSQQGLTSPRRLLRQRTRWHQGHMTALARVPQLWTAPGIRRGTRIELTGYLLIPYLITLPWSLVQQYLLLRLVQGHGLELFALPAGPLWLQALGGLGCYALAFAGHLAVAAVYWRRTGDQPLWKTLAYSHALVLWMYVSFIAVWRAVGRMITLRRGWAKTERSQEEPLVAADPQAAAETGSRT